ncbi:Histidine kinase [Siphonobacter aquaeclarae]|uniref:Histidine kinase n=2 Tax=Siphonobacter aquaeclarae TaxID=563176 RepID=A0A1G9HQ40_9BACT|nr:Histidine kinase [Siphonobacter aquaeclarae]
MEEMRRFFLRFLDVWLFAGLSAWLAIGQTLEQEPYTWARFAGILLPLLVVQLPVLAVTAGKEYLKERLSRSRYLAVRAGCFLVALPALTYFHPGTAPDGLFVLAACLNLALEGILTASAYFRNRQAPKVLRIGLDNAILLSITLVAAGLAAMSVSSMDDPAHYPDGFLLVHYLFDGPLILRHFGIFVQFFLQFEVMYLAGYVFYLLNRHFLVAVVLKEKGLLIYLLSFAAVLSLLYPAASQLIKSLTLRRIFGDIIENPFVFENALVFSGVMLVSLPVVLALQWAQQNDRISLLEQEKTRAELDLLRQQLNPHFFFNTLNNLYSLTLKQSPDAPESILQLSDLMRYVIYRGKEEQVAIQEEVQYLRDYLRLQQLRLRLPLALKVSVELDDEQQPISPLLLIVPVENAFKHGIEPAAESASLTITLRCRKGQLFFRCENSVEEQPGETGGIGLENLRRRLELLYPGKHRLTTSAGITTFTAELSLDL